MLSSASPLAEFLLERVKSAIRFFPDGGERFTLPGSGWCLWQTALSEGAIAIGVCRSGQVLERYHRFHAFIVRCRSLDSLSRAHQSRRTGVPSLRTPMKVLEIS